MILNYHPCNPPVMQAIRKHWSILQSSSNPELFATKPFIAYRRTTNIKNKVIRASITYPPTQGTQGREVHNIHTPCIRRICEICSLIQTTKKFHSSYTKRTYDTKKILHNQDCELFNLMYLITCKTCKKQYVGETK